MRRRPLLVVGSLLSLTAPVAQAACNLAANAGDTLFICDSGSAAALTDTDGNNSLVFPAGGTGAITGIVTFGGGRDSIDMASGSIAGNVVQGAGSDLFNMSAGLIGGNVNQGDGLDIFRMSGGRIVGTFDSGDYAEMDGGRIGNVNMRLDQNTFLMRGGSIDQNLITGFDDDYVEVFAGSIGGNISVSGGQDQVLIHGGQVGGDVLLSVGNDRFSWDGGLIRGRVDLGPGNDTAQLSGLGTDALGIVVDGNSGIDTLTFAASQPASGALYPGWEQIVLTAGSRLTLDDTLLLGDASTASGTLSLDASSVLLSRRGTLAAVDGAALATLNNAGTLDLRGGNDALGRFTVQGNYHGDNASLLLNTVLASDDAPSDRLVISQGAITGSTQLFVTHLGGSGAITTQNGIQVVEARDGAISTDTAFIQAGAISAGAFDYRLFKGGVTAGSENSWYLRSSLIAVPAPTPDTPQVQPAAQAPIAAPAPGQPALPAAQVGQSLPLYRPEVPVYAAAPRGGAVIVRQALATFHQRQSDQRQLAGTGSWGQAYGGRLREQWSGTVSPTLDGDLMGFKVGQDLYVNAADSGVRQHLGLYVGHSRLNADVKGFALALPDRQVGNLRLDGDSVGVYWTLVGPQQAYLDAVLQYTRLDGRARSERGGQLDIDGHAWAASVEVGQPFSLSAHWALEPQLQLIAQNTRLRSASDGIARVSHDAQTELTARVGLRLEGVFRLDAGQQLQPYAQLNLWHGDGGRDTLVFDGTDTIKTDYRYSAVQGEAGLALQASKALSLQGGVQYTRNLDSREQQASGVNLGLRWQF